MGPGTPSNRLRGPVAPRCVCFPPAGCVRWPIWTPNGPKTAPNGPKQGSRALGWAPVGSLLLVFAPSYPVNDPFGPKTAPKWPQNGPKRPQTGHNGPGTCTSRVWWPCLVTESTWATCGLPSGHVLPVFLPSMVCDLAPKQPQNGPKWPQDGPEMGLEMAENEFFPKKDPRSFGVPIDTFSGCFDPVLDSFEALFSPKRPCSNGPIWDRKGVKKWPKTCFFKDGPGPFGVLKHAF